MRAEQDILVLLQSCHSVLNTAWPQPDAPEMAGAHIFLHTNLFKAFETGVKQARRQCDTLPLSSQFRRLMDSISLVLERLLRQPSEPRTETDEAVNLLYLASGVAYHSAALELAATHISDERFNEVESLPEIMRKTKWRLTPGQDREALLEEVITSLEQALTSKN